MKKFFLKKRSIIVVGLFLILLILVLYFKNKEINFDNYKSNQKPINIKGIIVPHHLIVANLLDQFYLKISQNNDYENIVIIGPNHYDFGFNYIQTINQINLDDPVLTNQEVKLLRDAPLLNLEEIKLLSSGQSMAIENQFFSREHSIYTHYGFIKKYWPNAKVIPIIIKNNAPEDKLNNLIKDLQILLKQKTLFIFSIDFTHYSGEKFALKNDLKIIKLLSTENYNEKNLEYLKKLTNSEDKNNQNAVSLDSVESLYIATKLFNNNQFKWQFWERSSSSNIIKNLTDNQNTSHIFGYFWSDK